MPGGDSLEPIRKTHWDGVYGAKKTEETSWYQGSPRISLNMIARAGLDLRAPLIDVGCGGGILSESMAAQGAAVTGIDIADKALSVARLHLHESGCKVDYQLSTAESWVDNHPSSADVVTCMEMLEHVPDPASVVEACAGMLVPGGQLFLSTLNRNVASFAVAILGGEHIARVVPKGTHQYDRFIKPSELCQWLRTSGMKTMEITGVHYNPLERTARTGGHVRVNYIVHAVKSDQ